MNRKLHILFFSLLISAFGYCQEQEEEVIPSYSNRFAVGLSGSTLGAGAEISRNISRHFNLRLRGNLFSLNDYVAQIDLGGESLDLTANSRFVEVDLNLEYLPFQKSSFKLVGGLGYFINAEASALGIYNGTIEFGEIVLDQSDIGELDLSIAYEGFAPYLGLGFGRAVPKKRVGLSLEIGTFYLSEPKVQMTATEMLTSTADQAAQLQEDISDYRWYPFLNLRLAVKI